MCTIPHTPLHLRVVAQLDHECMQLPIALPYTKQILLQYHHLISSRAWIAQCFQYLGIRCPDGCAQSRQLLD